MPSDGIGLLQQKIVEFSPRRVLVLTGKERFNPFAEKLGLDIKWRTGLVEGIATDSGRQWVIARHPDPRSNEKGYKENYLVDEVLQAFAGQLEV